LFYNTMNVHFISLGCPRNLVDTEIMLGQLLEKGHTIVSEPSEADCVVVNTCGFTRPATDESIDTVLEMAGWKAEAEGRRLIVAGCLPERYGTDLVKSLPEVDIFLGTGAFHRIVHVVEDFAPENRVLLPPPVARPISGKDLPRLQTTPPHSAYLKIAEGCSNRCTYCVIPKLRGRHRSRPLGEIVSEAGMLAEAGAKELILVAQNTMAYAHDLHCGYGLEHLLAELAGISQLAWIRVLYGHPDYITDGLVETIGNHDKLLPYFDIPVQHISEPILKKMGRNPNSSKIFQLFDRLRRDVPSAVIRTTLMVGFPGETEEDFKLLLDLLERVRFDHMGTFMYSDEKDLSSSRLTGHVAEAVKEERFARLMAKQAAISRTNNDKYVGRTLEVLIEGLAQSKSHEIVGRTVFQAPEIDGIVHIKEGTAKPGSFARARIREASEYDLTGDIV
jgi:ribosomal protein S12 methylthiotransferase